MKEKITRVIFGTAVFFFILTLSIALPIYFRPFYYMQIEPLGLEELGYTREEIVEAYDEVLDYLTLPGREFGTGALAWSEEGKAHFEDCKVLFDLNLTVLLISGGVLAAVLLFRRFRGKAPFEPGKRHPAFRGALLALVIPVVVGGLAATDFDRAFVVFHAIFFPGKDNWIFDWNADEIIRILPQDFFMHCAILIAAGLVCFSLGTVAYQLLKARRRNKTENPSKS